MVTKRTLLEENQKEACRDRPKTLPRREIFAPDVKAIREQFGLSQSQMAAFLDVSKRTLEYWEQRRRGPMGPAQTLLRIMERDPHAVRRALRA